MKKRILVTGAAGFIGTNLCTRLLVEGHEVVGVDNLFSSRKDQGLGLLRSFGNFEFIRHDITFPLYVDGIDQIYNLACPASPVHYQRDPVQTMKVNVLGMINVLGLAKRIKSRVFQASTSEVYGDPAEHPQKESYWGHVNPTGIRSCYDEGKRSAETLCFDYNRQHKVDVRVGRIFNTYGPNMAIDDGRVVSNFIIQALKNEAITIYGSGQQTRSFCYVDDLVEALIKFMNTDNFIGPVNLGNPGEFTVLELAELVIKMTGSSAGITFKPLPQDDPKQRRPDISLAKETLGWEPKIPLETGLEKTVAYFRDRLYSLDGGAL